MTRSGRVRFAGKQAGSEWPPIPLWFRGGPKNQKSGCDEAWVADVCGSILFLYPPFRSVAGSFLSVMKGHSTINSVQARWEPTEKRFVRGARARTRRFYSSPPLRRIVAGVWDLSSKGSRSGESLGFWDLE